MNPENSLTIYYQNVNGLRTKSHMFLTNILNTNYDIVCITESWLNDSFYSSEYFDDRYEVFRCDRDEVTTGCKRGGSVLVAVRRKLCATSHSDWCAPPPADELWVSIPKRCSSTASSSNRTAQTYLHIICTYIPHGTQHIPLIKSFYDRVTDLTYSSPDDIFLVLGDFNVTKADWYYDEQTNSMAITTTNDQLSCLTSDFMSLALLNQYNSKFNDSKNRILDLVFCNEHCCSVDAPDTRLVTEDPHHKALEINISINLPTPLADNTVLIRKFFKADFDSIREGLSSHDWDFSQIILC